MDKAGRSFGFNLKEQDKMQEIKDLPLEKIKVGEHDQRLQIDDENLDGLVSSIAKIGLLYPIVVSPTEDGYLLVEGHRRYTAVKRLGKDSITCMVRTGSSAEVAEVALAGNFFRKDLSSIELAAAIAECFKNGTMTIQELASGFHRSENWVHRMIAICDWPADVQQAMHENGMSISAAANLALVTDDTYRKFLVRNAVEGGVSARTTAAWLQASRSLLPAEEAIQAEPVEGQPVQVPAVPQGPCFCCGTVYKVNEMSHVPMCGQCVQTIRTVS